MDCLPMNDFSIIIENFGGKINAKILIFGNRFFAMINFRERLGEDNLKEELFKQSKEFDSLGYNRK
ncbi:MAG: hypothetical protein J6581_00175 [Apibacter sp.]|nr:hypothetical protein [Apibacter sp.]